MPSDARRGRAAARAPGGREGVCVVVAGPDGTGKSTVVAHLVDEVLAGRVQVLHHRPHLLGQRTRHEGAVTEPHRQQPYPKGFSVAKLLFVYLDYLVGWFVKVRPWLLDGRHVVIERGWWDLLIDPRRYRLRQAPRLVAALGRFLPRPDVTVVLGGDAVTIAARTSELSVEETERQLRAWASLPTTRLRMRQIDATQPLSDVLSSVRRAVVSAANDEQWVLLPTTTHARWYFPSTPSRAGVNALRLYHPVTPRGRVAWEAARGVAALGGFRLLARDGWRPPEEVLDLLADHLPLDARVAVARGRRQGRHNAMILDGRTGAALTFAKIAVDREGPDTLAAEVAANSSLTPLLPVGLRAPRVLHHDRNLVLFEPIAAHPRRRPWRLPPDLAYLLGKFHRAGSRPDGLGVAHGDCAPWNLLRTEIGWFLVDWSDAHDAAPPFEDVLNHLVQSHALLGRPNRQELLAAILGRGRSGEIIRRYAEGAQVAVADAARLIPDYLERTLETIDRTAPDGLRGVRARESLLLALRAEDRPARSRETSGMSHREVPR
jgi:thymidylate kinase